MSILYLDVEIAGFVYLYYFKIKIARHYSSPLVFKWIKIKPQTSCSYVRALIITRPPIWYIPNKQIQSRQDVTLYYYWYLGRSKQIRTELSNKRLQPSFNNGIKINVQHKYLFIFTYSMVSEHENRAYFAIEIIDIAYHFSTPTHSFCILK